MTSKKALDASYTSIPALFPDQIRIIGGLELKDERERGPLDTGKLAKHPLYVARRLARPLKASFIDSIDQWGLIVPPSIVKLDGVPTVDAGRRRVRAARVVNALRKEKCRQGTKADADAAEACAKAGLPLIKIKCDLKAKNDDHDLSARLAIENSHRENDDLDTILEILPGMIDTMGGDLAMVASIFDVDVQTVRGWQLYHQNATDATKALVAQGRISPTAAAALATVIDPAEQNSSAQKYISSGDLTVRNARRIVSAAKGGRDTAAFTGKRQVMKFRDYLKEEGGDGVYWEGVMAGLNLITTGKAGDARLGEVYRKFVGTTGANVKRKSDGAS